MSTDISKDKACGNIVSALYFVHKARKSLIRPRAAMNMTSQFMFD